MAAILRQSALLINRAPLGYNSRRLARQRSAGGLSLSGSYFRREIGGRSFLVRAVSEDKSEAAEAAVSPSALDIRVGKVLSCERHPDADALYVEEIDVGEGDPRTICSGLVPYVDADQLRDALVVVLCNLKARNLRGVKSHGMVLCASDKENGRVAPLVPPADATIGESIVFGEGDGMEPETENKVKKKKIWEKLQPLMRTNNEGIALCDGKTMCVASGPIACETLVNTPIS